MTQSHPGVRRASLLLVLGTGIFVNSGCGASTARLGVGPVLDSNGNVGIESTFSLGFGMPVEYDGRSQHHLQGLGFAGGGGDVDTGAKIVTAGIGADYIYWAHPRLDVRAGMYFVYRNRDDKPKEHDLAGLGAHIALMPVVIGDDTGIFIPQFCIGPEFRIDHSWDQAPYSNASRTHYSFPLVFEANLFAAGD